MSENGVISVGARLSTPPQASGASLYQDAGDTFLIAPYWADNSIISGGRVRYEQYKRNHPSQDERFNLVQSYIASRNESSEAFEGTYMLLVGWEECVPNVERGTTISGQV